MKLTPEQEQDRRNFYDIMIRNFPDHSTVPIHERFIFAMRCEKIGDDCCDRLKSLGGSNDLQIPS